MNLSHRHPYYIIAPPYIRTSAGVRVLYKLADLINKAGGSAYIYLRPHSNHSSASSPMDIAPFLTQKTIDYHFANGITPIVIYPETIKVAKFSAPVRIRYLLNYDDLLFANDPLTEDDFLLCYSKNIEEQIGVNLAKQTLFLPVSDATFYRPPPDGSIRKGACYYAGKFKYKFNGRTLPITNNLPEITRDQPNSQTPEEIRTLFQNSELFYCYEDSALALEAMLCGCPTVFLPNSHFSKTLGSAEINGIGYAWGNTPEQIDHAKSTVSKLRDKYCELNKTALDNTLEFIIKTQEIAEQKKYLTPFSNGFHIEANRFTKLIDFYRFIFESIIDLGLVNFSKIVCKRIMSGRIRFLKS